MPGRDDLDAGAHGDEPSLPARLDDALQALWSGDSARLERLIQDVPDDPSDGPSPPSAQSTRVTARLREAAMRIASSGSYEPFPNIRNFRIVREIGRGGMGIVYEARQIHPDRGVAIKVIRAGHDMDQSHRRFFAREVQALARLQHPNIAAIYEAGVTEDHRPFFAMELIEGHDMIACAEARDRKGQDRDLPGRLDMFCRVCDAIHFAHQRGVIHRDLKPSNVLVSQSLGSSTTGSTAMSPHVKVLDFGLARLMENGGANPTVTMETGQIRGTIAYMSPEQVRGDIDDIDVRTDVYALGVMLYQLLAGVLPHDVAGMALPEAVRAIHDSEPHALGSVDRTLRGDLETIVAKAMEKDRTRRYQSAAELAADIGRYLRHESIAARPASVIAQIRKFSRRHKAAVVGGVLVAAALSIGLVGTTLALIEARTQASAAKNAQLAESKQNALAQAQVKTARAVIEFLSKDLLGQATPLNHPDREVTLRQVLDEAAAKIEFKFADEPVAEAAIRMTLGTTYRMLGQSMTAEPHLVRALALRREHLGNAHNETRHTLTALGAVWGDLDRFDDAGRLLNEVMSIGRGRTVDDERETLLAMSILAYQYDRRGFNEKALPLHQQVLEATRRLDGDRSDSTVDAMSSLAQSHVQRGEFDLAESLFRHAINTSTRAHGEDGLKTLTAMNNLAALFVRQDRMEDALPLLEAAVEGAEDVLGTDHVVTLVRRNNLALAYAGIGRMDEAAALLQESLDVTLASRGREHVGTATAMNNLGGCRLRQKRFADAAALFSDALTIQDRLLGENHIETLYTMTDLATAYLGMNDLVQAQPLLDFVLKAARATLSQDHPLLLNAIQLDTQLRKALTDDQR
jgi:eukaryotic-like serine/threonine-protein kinase